MISMILHVTLDEKFVTAADLVFSKAFPSGKNDFYLITTRDNQLKHVELRDNYQIIHTDKKSLNFLRKIIPKYDLIVFHFLPDFSVKLINRLKSKVPFMWMVWGTEIYGTSLYKEEVLGDLSRKYFQKEDRLVRFQREFRRLAIEIVRFKELKLSPDGEKRKALKRIKFIGTIDEREFASFAQLGLLKEGAEYIRFTYYPLEYIFANDLSTYSTGNNILIGNSATVTNNHLEVFEKLKVMELDTRKVIVPLSYGSKNYAETIIKDGHQAFGANFDPLVDFMPLEAYQKIVSDCNIVIMNHYRQQAVGNIIAMLWKGAKVFLSERSILYGVFTQMGCKVFSVEKDLVLENSDCLSPLSGIDVEENRRILFSQFSLDAVVRKLKIDITQALGK